MRLKAILAAMWIAMVLALGCAASRTQCKIAKPSPIIQHKVALDNETWHCVEFGIDAKEKRPTYVCTNKLDGSRIRVTPIQ